MIVKLTHFYTKQTLPGSNKAEFCIEQTPGFKDLVFRSFIYIMQIYKPTLKRS